MENNKFKSLAQQLIQDGILSQNLSYDDEIANFYDIKADENIENSPFAQKPDLQSKNPVHKKRINMYDANLTDDKQNKNTENKTTKLRFGDININKVLFKLFPRFYKAKLAKEAMKKLNALNINADNLREKTIPYGENEIRYNELIKYISTANEIQQNLNEKLG